MRRACTPPVAQRVMALEGCASAGVRRPASGQAALLTDAADVGLIQAREVQLEQDNADDGAAGQQQQPCKGVA